MEKKYYLKPGFIFFSSEGHIMETILGSCVSVCLWDKKEKTGIMIHYIYAFHKKEESRPITGVIALPFALQTMINKGSCVENLIAFVAGGGKNKKLSGQVGTENSEYALKFLKDKGIKIEKIDIGAEESRKVIFNSNTGEFIVTKFK